MARQPNPKQRSVSSAISRTVAVITTILGLAWLLGAPTSGCIAPKCSAGACVLSQLGGNCGAYDAGVCPADGGLCNVQGRCDCIPGRPGCDYSACEKAQNDQSETECNAGGTCVWSLACASSVNCMSPFDENECNSHPQCTFEPNQECM
jgi:hypothetical protein